MVIAAEHYASRLVVPQSQRTPTMQWSSHRDRAARALAKLAGPHLPASLRQLEAAVKRAHADRDSTRERSRTRVCPNNGTEAADDTLRLRT